MITIIDFKFPFQDPLISQISWNAEKGDDVNMMTLPHGDTIWWIRPQFFTIQFPSKFAPYKQFEPYVSL